jgi:nicotinamidase/pyrazinamidase
MVDLQDAGRMRAVTGDQRGAGGPRGPRIVRRLNSISIGDVVPTLDDRRCAPPIDPASAADQLSGSTEDPMARVIFWDVDTQYDFMRSDGKLYVPDAEQIVPNLKRLTDYAHAKGIRIVASADDHVPGHRELAKSPDWKETFPEHCMRGTRGQAKIPETRLREPLLIEPGREDAASLADRVRAHPGDVLFHKHRFDVFTNENVETVLGVLLPEAIVIYGVALDVCNKYAIEGMVSRHPEIRLFAVSDAMKPIDRDVAQHLLRQWSEQGVRIVETTDIVEEGLIDSLLAA